MKHSLLLSATLGLLAPLAAWAALHPKADTTLRTIIDEAEKIGNMSLTEFKARNKAGGDQVAAIRPTPAALSATDKMLMDKVVMGGKKQLMISQSVLAKLQDREAKILAESEVEEQTQLDAKLKEIGAAKGYTPPVEASRQAEQAAAPFRAMNQGKKLDHQYVMVSGVKNHQKLLETMTMVKAQATDPALKALANATLPVIKMHLNVSQQVHPGLMAADGNQRGMGKMKGRSKDDRNDD